MLYIFGCFIFFKVFVNVFVLIFCNLLNLEINLFFLLMIFIVMERFFFILGVIGDFFSLYLGLFILIFVGI